MTNNIKFVEIVISLQAIFISSMIPVYISLPFTNEFYKNHDLPVTWQIPSIILISIIFSSK